MARRLELKYVVDTATRELLLRRWRPFLAADAHADDRAVYPVLSLYFDTPRLRFYWEKVDGEALRDKVRLRGYAYTWEAMPSCFLEVKRKVGSRITKLRRDLGAYRQWMATPSEWRLDPGDEQLQRAALLAAGLRLRPAAQTFYLRQVYESPHLPGLRIVFDSNLVGLLPGQPLQRHMLVDPGYRCLRDDQLILEIKVHDVLPGWVAAGIQAAELAQRSVSKYLLAVERLGLHREEIGVYA